MDVECPKCGAVARVVSVGRKGRVRYGDAFARCRELRELPSGQPIDLGRFECAALEGAIKRARQEARR